jgi:cytochrome b561/polyisoprenoid-binding protein YceI
MKPSTYNLFSRYLHWLIAGLIIFMIILGWRLGDQDSSRLSRINLHKSVGILVLLLTFLRLGLRLVYPAPPEVPMAKWQAIAAKLLHIGFYVVMIAMPLTGWLMVSTSVRPIPFFGLLTVPHLPVPQSRAVHDVFEGVHDMIAKIIIFGMVPLHVAAALKHHFVDKDAVFNHMVSGLTPKPLLNWRWAIPLGTIALATGLGFFLFRAPAAKVADKASLTAPAPASQSAVPATPEPLATVSTSASKPAPVQITKWKVDKATGRIGFSTSFEGEAISGGFGQFEADIDFQPDQLAGSHVRVTIDLASVHSGDDDRDATLRNPSFFDTASATTAIFEARRFTKTTEGHFIAHGNLTLHGIKRPIDLPFSLKIDGKIATMSGQTALDRTAFGVGSGDYESTSSIPAKVAIDIHITAKAID